MTHDEKALQFVMLFYNVTQPVAVELYSDEIEAYKRLMSQLEHNDPPSPRY